jgi:hypothetical protein
LGTGTTAGLGVLGLDVRPDYKAENEDRRTLNPQSSFLNPKHGFKGAPPNHVLEDSARRAGSLGRFLEYNMKLRRFQMAKKIAVGLLLAVLACGMTFALSAGAGGAFDVLFGSTKTGDTETKQSTIGGGFFVFLDADYVEVDVDMLFAGASSEGEKLGGLTYFGLSALGKYPFDLGSFVLFPLVGIDWQLWQSFKPESGDKISRGNFDDADAKTVYDNFSIAVGAGADFPIGEKLFVRGELLWNFRLLSKYDKNAKDEAEANDVEYKRFVSGPRLKVAVGYKF